MDLVQVESPFAGNTEENRQYALKAMRDCFDRDEAPFASHILYTEVLNDELFDERELGIRAGLCWGEASERTVVYVDLGITRGMVQGIEAAHATGRPVVFRSLNPERSDYTQHELFAYGLEEQLSPDKLVYDNIVRPSTAKIKKIADRIRTGSP